MKQPNNDEDKARAYRVRLYEDNIKINQPTAADLRVRSELTQKMRQDIRVLSTGQLVRLYAANTEIGYPDAEDIAFRLLITTTVGPLLGIGQMRTRPLAKAA